MDFVAIDEFLLKLENSANDAEMRQLFSEFDHSFDTNVPDDPFGPAYRQKQFDLYERLAGQAYSPQNEQSPFDVAGAAIRPFPYLHGSSELVGEQLMAMGFIIKAMGLPQGARILEFGPGWGNTTLALAKMGYEVTAIDIELNFVDLINKRAKMEALDINVIHGDFSLIETIEGSFDAILFFECFHHAQGHLDIMRAFDRVVAPGGLVCFAAEPITEDFPIPWGLRMDGQSLWAIRKNGWLELGFSKSYFLSALRRFGWLAANYVGQDSALSNVFIVRRLSNFKKQHRYTNLLKYQVGTFVNGTVEIFSMDTGYVLFGPYEVLPAGDWCVTLILDTLSNNFGDLEVDIVDCFGQKVIAILPSITFTSKSPPPKFTFKNIYQLHNYEIRIQCKIGSQFRIIGFDIELLP